MLKRGLQAALLCVAMVVMLGAGQSRFDKMGHEMICTCGCTQILLECNHVGCPVSPVMMGELQQQIALNSMDTPVLNWFAAKYGATVLAAPIRGGFDDVAWIMPLAMFALATVGTAVVVWVWRKRTLRLAGVSPSFPDGGRVDSRAAAGLNPEEAAMRERIRRETEYR